MKTWYRLRAARTTAELRLYDEIGAWGITSKNLVAELDALGEITTLTVRINSPGGDVFDALAIHNALSRHPARVVVHIDALCASAATLIALAADEVRMADNGMFMIHEPWTVSMGNSAELLKQSDLLDTTAENIVGIYARKTGMDPTELRDLMRAETWYTAEQALAAGFVDAIDEPLKMAALISHNLNQFRNRPLEKLPMTDPTPVPETPDTPKLTAPTPPPEPIMEPEALAGPTLARMCNDAKLAALTPVLLATPHTETQAKARIAQAQGVRQICTVARQPEKAEALILEGATETDAKLACWNALIARAEAAPVDNSVPAPIADHLPLDERCAAEWQRSPELRAEFGTLAIYTAYTRAQTSGRVKTYGGRA